MFVIKVIGFTRRPFMKIKSKFWEMVQILEVVHLPFSALHFILYFLLT